MTDDQFAEWAEESGIDLIDHLFHGDIKELQAFAKMVRNATLEEAAVKCEKEAAKFPTYGIGSEDSDISHIEIIRSMKS